MIARAEAFQAAVTLLRDLAPYEQSRQIVQMVYDGSLTQQQGQDLMSALVDYEIDPSGARVSPLSQVRSVTYVSGPESGWTVK